MTMTPKQLDSIATELASIRVDLSEAAQSLLVVINALLADSTTPEPEKPKKIRRKKEFVGAPALNKYFVSLVPDATLPSEPIGSQRGIGATALNLVVTETTASELGNALAGAMVENIKRTGRKAPEFEKPRNTRKRKVVGGTETKLPDEPIKAIGIEGLNGVKYVATDDDLPESFTAIDGPTNPYPTRHMLEEYKKWATDVAKRLAGQGMNSPGLKLRNFILGEAKVTRVTDITAVSWEEIKNKIDTTELTELVALVGRTI